LSPLSLPVRTLIFFYDRREQLMPVPKAEVIPFDYEQWATQLAARFPHIEVQLERD
jgi:hypothetical protein